MSRTDYKETELRSFAEIIEKTDHREEILKKMNAYIMGKMNGKLKAKRYYIWKDLLKEYH